MGEAFAEGGNDGLRFLGIYLNDHLAGAVGGIELAKRALASNRGTALGDYLEGFLAEIQEDRESLERLMDRLGIRRTAWKQAAAWTAEKALWAKLNGRLVGYSPLSRLEELEMLCLGVEAKLEMLRALSQTARAHSDLDGEEVERLAGRASAQRKNLEEHRLEAVANAFG